MNVLLAEANVSYDLLVEMEDVNPTMETVDVCVVIGANDVVNPAARDDPDSPIYGMPIIEVDRARVVIVLKRSMASRVCGDRKPTVLQGQHPHALRGRQEQPALRAGRIQGKLVCQTPVEKSGRPPIAWLSTFLPGHSWCRGPAIPGAWNSSQGGPMPEHDGGGVVAPAWK